MLSDIELIERILGHVEAGTTDMGEETWREPVENYSSQERFKAELNLMRHLPVPFCPAAALPEVGSYVARRAAGVPIVVVRGEDGKIRAFRNACRHRGMQLAAGSGCTRIFRCTYHGWAYRLDGRLEHIPHGHGFPDVSKSAHGLVPLRDVEVAGGLVFVTQDEPVGRGALEALPPLLDDSQVIFESGENVNDINWKLQIEGTLEGYHIKPTHPQTFFPYGYDNLNVVETEGPNSRVCFPFRRIEKLKDVPVDERELGRTVTLVNHIFPFAQVVRLSDHMSVSFIEPESPTQTRYFTYRLTLPRGSARGDREADPSSADHEAIERAKRDAAFLSDTGLKEDAKVVRDIQAAIGSGANTHYTFGAFEKAIVHLHKNLAHYLARLEQLEAQVAGDAKASHSQLG